VDFVDVSYWLHESLRWVQNVAVSFESMVPLGMNRFHSFYQ